MNRLALLIPTTVIVIVLVSSWVFARTWTDVAGKQDRRRVCQAR